MIVADGKDVGVCGAVAGIGVDKFDARDFGDQLSEKPSFSVEHRPIVGAR